MRSLPEARVARLAECHKKQKAGYNQHTSPQTTKGSEKANVASAALKYWQDEFDDSTTTRFDALISKLKVIRAKIEASY